MAAPGRSNSGGEMKRQHCLAVVRFRAPGQRRFLIAFCCWMLTATGCTLWREARDSLNYSQNLYRRALEAETNGQTDDAIRLLQDSINANPDDPEIRWELARLLLDHGKTSEALLELRYLVKNYPDDSRAYITLSRTLLERNRPDDAAKLIDLAIDLDSQSTEAFLLRGQIAEVRGDVDLARETYHRVLLQQPELVDVRLRLSRIEIEHGDSRVAAALLRETLANVPLSPDQFRTMNWMLGTAYAMQERWDDAAEAMSRGLPPDHGTPRQHYELAFACFRAGQHQQALEQVSLVLEAEPNHSPARQMYAELNTQQTTDPLRQPAVLPTGHSR